MFDSIISPLPEQGWSVSDQVLPESVWNSLRSWGELQLHRGKLSDGQIGRGADRERIPEIRGDLTLWLEPHDQPEIFSYLQNLRMALNEKLFLGLQEIECHLAFYPIGSFYKKHLDRSTSLASSASGERVLSFVLYLNREWAENDGGKLRLNAAGKDILPLGGRFVLFRSDTIEHEVLPCYKNRWSLTGWFRRRTL